MKIFKRRLSSRERTRSEYLQNLESLFAFVQEICSRLVKIIQSLPKEHNVNNRCGVLLLRLKVFQAQMIRLQHDLANNDAKRARNALDMLERLCRWPRPYYPNDAADSSFSPDWYPSLSELLRDEECIRETLSKFFDDFKLQEAIEFWTKLSASLSVAGSEKRLRGPGLSELLEWRNTIEDCQDKQRFIVSLHNSLMKYCHCHCKQACGFLAVNIRLNYNDSRPRRTNKISKFNLLFQDLHDTQASQSSCYWRDIQISVYAASKRSTFEENCDVGEAYGSTIEGSELQKKLRLCQFITEAQKNQLQVKLIASNGDLKLEKESIPSRRFLTNVPSTSLDNLLEYSKLTNRNKMILSYLLVDSVWQYYDCSWGDWNTKTVQFMSERVGLKDVSEVIFVNQPFLHATFGKKVMQEVNTQRRESHCYPKILALGIILLEIQLGCRLESFKNGDFFDQDSNITQHLLASALLEDKKIWPPANTWVLIKEIIEMCIDEEKSKAMLENDSLTIRQRIYEQIVAPFRVFILEAWGPKGIENVDPIIIEKAKCSEEGVSQPKETLSWLNTNELSPTPPLQMMTHKVSEQKEVSRPWLGGITPPQLLESSTNWFNNLDTLTAKLSIIEASDRKGCPQMKIAILDTGITEECYCELNEYIEEYKDFVSKQDEIRQDGTGHGSTTLRLLLKLNSSVKVFVGRVFEHGDADDQTERVMAEAIMHAKMKWKVDIICIPSGFNPDLPNPPYRRELHDAVTALPKHKSDPKAIIIAAASNLGLKSEITYPGCLSKSSKVLCLFATDGDGDPSRFNPAAVPNTYNFALLGEGIKIDIADQPIRGTSFSTIIAGAIAAYIMDFVNHPDTKGKILDVWSLREVEGMASVLASMLTVEKNEYHILEPWKLLEHYQPRELSMMELRQEICRNISKALGTRNSRRR